MSRNKLIQDENLNLDQTDPDFWPTVDVSCLDETDKEVFLKRKEAIDLYVKNEITLEQIKQLTGVNRRNLNRLIKRCMEYDPYGIVWGYRGLIPNKNIKSYELDPINNKLNESRKTGEFERLLVKYPMIDEMIKEAFLGQNKKLSEPVMRAKQIHKKFVDECKKYIPRSEYPFNTERLGYRALCRYLIDLRNKYFGKAASRYGDAAAQKARYSGIGEQNYPQTITPYQEVQFDGHRIDGIFVITFTTPEGDQVTKELDRLFVLAIEDVATRNIIGPPHICLNKEYNASDVMICARSAIMPVKQIPLTIDGLSFQPTGGYPSERYPELEWTVWDVICFDNAKAHLADMVKDRLRNLIGCATNLGPVARPMRRSFIERFYHTLTHSSIQRLPNTTGSGPDDPRRKEPEKMAIKYVMTYEQLQELVRVVVSDYNGTPHGGLYYNSPLDVLEQRMNKGLIPRQLSEVKRSEFLFLQMTKVKTVRGNIETGKRPYIEFLRGEYRNDVLARSGHLTGTKLTIHINVDDLRTVKAFLPDGSELGELVVAGKWSLTPHTYQMRKAINQLAAKKVIHYTQWDDPVFVYYEYLANQAKEGKRRAPNKVAQVKEAISKGDEEKSISKRSEALQNEHDAIAALDQARELRKRHNEEQNKPAIKKHKTIIY